MISVKQKSDISGSRPGRLSDMGDFRLHYLFSSASVESANLPTIIIEAGCGFPFIIYSRLYQKLSKHLSIFCYDRAGLGWSEESHQARDAEQITTHLHTLLNKVDISGPKILVGHSIAGLYLRIYAHKYPNDIVGLVLLDSSHPQQYELLEFDEFPFGRRLLYRTLGLCAYLKVAHLFDPLLDLNSSFARDLPFRVINQLLYLSQFKQTYITPLKEFDSFCASAKQALSDGDLDDLPLLVVSGPNRDDTYFPSKQGRKRFVKDWMLLQHDLLKLSADSEHHIFETASHCSLVTSEQYAQQVAEVIIQFASRHLLK